jgi:protein-tyrosine phosphatase
MNFSRITDDLFIGNTLGADDYDHLRDLGVRLVINMRLEKRLAADLHRPLLKFLWLPTADTPLLVIPLCCLRRGVRAALEAIKMGGKVYVHCAKGRHRGVAMGASILIALGYAPEQATEPIKTRRPIADPDIFYIRSRILQFARKYQTIG